ncbi:FkbM family methyltransferase [Peribacillus frigoritolerans]|uniref:FkbM family methyltransferase n=1 Tax=Peribacillus frigoritolerans TaxID=450367 RepID=UPI003B8B845F
MVTLDPFVKANIVFDGIHLEFLTHKEDVIVGDCLRNGVVFENHILNYLKSIIKPGSRVLDAGANIGAIAIPLAKAQPSATIYCFEPDPLNYSLLILNITLNDINNIIAFNYALGEKDEFITFFRNDHNYGDHRTSRIPINHKSFKSSPNRIHMVNPVTFLKQSLGQQSPNYFDIIKIDTQGADFEILESCLPLIKADSEVVIEYSPIHLRQYGTPKAKIKDIISYFSSIEVLGHTISSTSKEKVLSDFDILHSFYDIVLKGKK